MSSIAVHPAAIDPEALLADCDATTLRRSGPGGQNRNKVETAVILRHRPTGLLAEANERRSQAENRREALFRLRVNLALGVRTPSGSGRAPSTLWMSRRAGGGSSSAPSTTTSPPCSPRHWMCWKARGWT